MKKEPNRFTTVWYVFLVQEIWYFSSARCLSGEHFWPAILGFIISGVGIAVITLIVGTLNPKNFMHENLSRKISPLFATVYLVALYLAIGPFFAIPRTATTSFELELLHCWAMRIWVHGCLVLRLLLCGSLSDCPQSISDFKQYRTYFNACFAIFDCDFSGARYC